jgi:hypothetical protein
LPKATRRNGRRAQLTFADSFRVRDQL